MISKENLLKNFANEDKDSVIRIYNNLILAKNKDIPVFSKNFCSPNIWSYFVENFNKNDFIVEADGAYDEADRRIISFNNKYFYEYPFICLKITNKSKFKNLTHKDYLGSIMSLGIEREKLGDLRVVEDYAVVPVYEDIASYIITSMESVGRCPVKIEIIDKEHLPQSVFEEIVINIPSLRIDNYVSKLANVSRAKAIELIQNNKVSVNYCKIKEKSKEVQENNVITISGVGKFRTGSIVGNTKSGKIKVVIKNYI